MLDFGPSGPLFITFSICCLVIEPGVFYGLGDSIDATPFSRSSIIFCNLSYSAIMAPIELVICGEAGKTGWLCYYR